MGGREVLAAPRRMNMSMVDDRQLRRAAALGLAPSVVVQIIRVDLKVVNQVLDVVEGGRLLVRHVEQLVTR